MGSNNYYVQDRNLKGKGGGEREREKELILFFEVILLTQREEEKYKDAYANLQPEFTQNTNIINIMASNARYKLMQFRQLQNSIFHLIRLEV